MLTIDILAFEADCYYAFSDVFDPLIKCYQPNYRPNLDNRPNLNPTPLLALEDIDNEGFEGTRISVSRNITGFPFPPGCNRMQRRQIESIVCHSLNAIGDPFKGVYYSITDMSEEAKENFFDLDISIDKPIPVYDKCQISTDWPEARGLWLSQDKSIVIYVNDVDHIKFVAIKHKESLHDIFSKLCGMVALLENFLLEMGHCYVWSFSKGYLVSNPFYVGTTLVCETLIYQDKFSDMELEDFKSLYISNLGKDQCKLIFDNFSNKIRVQSFPVYPVSELEQIFHFYKYLAQISNKDIPLIADNFIQLPPGENNVVFPLFTKQKNDISKVLTPDKYITAIKKDTSGEDNTSDFTDMICFGVKDVDNNSFYTDGYVCKNVESYNKYDFIVKDTVQVDETTQSNFWKKLDNFSTFDNIKFPFDDFVSDCFVMSILNMSDYNFTPFMEKSEINEPLKISKEILQTTISPKFAGTFCELADNPVQQGVVEAKIKSLLYPSWDASKFFFRNWPTGRAFWISEDRSMLCWINETDHVKYFAFNCNKGIFKLWERYQIFMNAFQEGLNTVHVKTTTLSSFPSLSNKQYHVGAVINSRNKNLTYLKNLMFLTGFQIVNLRMNETLVEMWVIQNPSSCNASSQNSIVNDEIEPETDLFQCQMNSLMTKISYLRFLIKHSFEDNNVLDDSFMDLKIMAGKVEIPREDSQIIKSIVSKNFDNFPDFRCKYTAISRLLTPEVYKNLEEFRSSNGISLDDCIQVGVDNQGRHFVGMIALDEECYDLYGDLMDAIVQECSKDRVVKHVYGDIAYFPEVSEDLNADYVFFLEFSVIRNLYGFPLVGGCRDISQLKHVYQILKRSLTSKEMKPTLEFTDFTSVSEEVETNLINEYYNEDDSLIHFCPQLKRYWPRYRAKCAIPSSYSDVSDITAFINVQDHLQCFKYFDCQDVWKQFKNLYQSLNALERGILDSTEGKVHFMKHERYGYITCCPSDLGAGLQIKIRLKLANILKSNDSTDNGGGDYEGKEKNTRNKNMVNKIIKPTVNQYNLRITFWDDQILELTNRSCFGYSEVEIFQQIIDCTKDLIRKEIEMGPVLDNGNVLENGEDVSDDSEVNNIDNVS
ncbi:unnamed protein product [Gordionus sp. m RMFG-2023]